MTWKRTKRWIYATIELQQGEKRVKCPNCGNETLDYGFIMLDKVSKMGYGLIWCNSCHHGFNLCRANLKNEKKLIVEDDVPKEIVLDN